jgi:excisionase family DNA binding protein
MERLITPQAAADLLAVPKNTILDWLRSGQLKGVKAGRLWRLRERDLAEFLKEPGPVRETTPADEPALADEPTLEETNELEGDDIINWDRYDELKAQGFSRRAIAREMRMAETTLRRMEKRR